VQYGAADLGVAGSDLLAEHGGQGLYQPLDLGIARCRMAVAVPAGFDYAAAVRSGARLRVATKYIRTVREHFAAKGVHVDLIRLYGSMELAPLVGLADAIVDLVDTGRTLAANRLEVVEEMMDVSSRLIANPASMKLKRSAIAPVVESIGAAVRRG
jgi:ATP phosphoribosyltransferase